MTSSDTRPLDARARQFDRPFVALMSVQSGALTRARHLAALLDAHRRVLNSRSASGEPHVRRSSAHATTTTIVGRVAIADSETRHCRRRRALKNNRCRSVNEERERAERRENCVAARARVRVRWRESAVVSVGDQQETTRA